MTNRRYVPLVTGLLSLGLAGWLVVGPFAWWKGIIGAFLVLFGWGSMKTGLFATDAEIAELTSPGPASEETMKKLEDRF
ncbi:MAG: hypothetical protein NXI02_32765 [Rhodobacteraceae bacterium]|nr:hypothetical protein [Paracoccaceae bacterium]